MKKIVLILVLLCSIAIFSQKKASKKIETNVKEIEIFTEGLDDFVLESSDSRFVEIYLFAENSNKQHIVFEEENNGAIIKFNLQEFKTEETVFRKFITKRLQRASAVVKIPRHIIVTVFGENTSIIGKSFENELHVFLENGNVKLGTIKENTTVKLYAGNVYAALENIDIDIVSKNGKIKVDDILVEKRYQKKELKSTKKFTVKTIKANIFLTTKKTQ